MADKAYRVIDISVVSELVAADTPWPVIQSIVGASRSTILRRLAKAGAPTASKGRGRPPLLSPEMKEAVLKLTNEGVSQAEVAERMRVSTSTIQAFLAKAVPDRKKADRRMCGSISLDELHAMRDAEVPVPAIADAAGVTPANVYHHLRRLRTRNVSGE